MNPTSTTADFGGLPDPLSSPDVTPDWRPVRRVRDAKASLKTKPKRRTEAQVLDAKAWRGAVLSKRTAVLWTAEDYPVIAEGKMPRLHPHHIVTRAECKKHGVTEWDVRNGVPVSERRHARHHSRHEPIHLSELPDEVYGFLADYPALKPYFDRTYFGGGRAACERRRDR